MSPLREQFGDIDIYLFDQLLRGRIRRNDRILDAGCGGGRNLVYFLHEGYEVFAVDSEKRAIENLPADHFRAEPLEAMSFPDAFFDVAIVSAVLHFAKSDDHFLAMLHGVWRVLKPGGLFFCRLASSIGIENRIQRVSEGRYLLPDGSERYLADETKLMNLTEQLGGKLLDPLKTTVVQNQRSMTTWVLQKG
ncbi:MAG TPA: class I SAM-dependent methyltransferase [Bryobacteraceae bacterium]|jgi:SAM-dependent methyltransferase|nr:class I SAM-dependent methyltransferase [Bryobacteraceae bacterium]